MNRSKDKLNAPGTGPEEADPFNAMDALRAGEALPLGYFVRDLAQAVGILADLLDPPNGATPRLQFVPPGPRTAVEKRAPDPEIEAEWESTLAQLEEAIQLGSAAPVGCYLRDVRDVLGLLATALDPPASSRGWRLEFGRKGRGRRPDPKKFRRDSAIATEVLFATRATGKQEAEIAELQAKRGISRATFFRAKKKNNKIRTSHKKR